MHNPCNRRKFMKQAGAMGAGAAAFGLTGRVLGADSPAGPAAKPQKMPAIKIGGLEISRLVLGSNPFWGYSHKSKQLDEEMKAYHTDERIMSVLDEAAANGITTLASPPDQRWVDLWAKYQAAGGKLKIWISQCHGPAEKMLEEIERSAKGGAKAVFIQGHRVEQQFDKGAFDTLRAWIDKIKSYGLPAGTAAHYPEIALELEKRKFPTDFYYQCFYNVTKSGQWADGERSAAVATIKQIEKPVIAYKILAAGRLPPEQGFEYAVKHIAAKDGICVGVYVKDAADQIRQDALFMELLS